MPPYFSVRTIEQLADDLFGYLDYLFYVEQEDDNIPASNENNECELATAEIVSRLVDLHGLDRKVVIKLIIDGL